MAKNGQFYKAVGGDQGAVKLNGRWHRFDCVGCMYAKGIINPVDRLQGVAINLNALQVEYRHEPEAHTAWLKAGKPINTPHA